MDEATAHEVGLRQGGRDHGARGVRGLLEGAWLHSRLVELFEGLLLHKWFCRNKESGFQSWFEGLRKE